MKRYNSTTPPDQSNDPGPHAPPDDNANPGQDEPALPPEVGGRRKGLEPTRYGDWEKDGRCIDF